MDKNQGTAGGNDNTLVLSKRECFLRLDRHPHQVRLQLRDDARGRVLVDDLCFVAGWRCVKRSLSCGCQVQGPSGSGRRYGERPAPLPRLCVYGMIRTPKVTTADWNGVRVPMLALMVPLLPAAGALMEPTVVAAGAEPPEPVW